MRPYSKLRGKMTEMDITGEMLANYLNVSKTYISNRLNHKLSWNIDEIYIVMDYLQIPREEIFDYFPPDAGIKRKAKRLKMSA